MLSYHYIGQYINIEDGYASDIHLAKRHHHGTSKVLCDLPIGQMDIADSIRRTCICGWVECKFSLQNIKGASWRNSATAPFPPIMNFVFSSWVINWYGMPHMASHVSHFEKWQFYTHGTQVTDKDKQATPWVRTCNNLAITLTHG